MAILFSFLNCKKEVQEAALRQGFLMTVNPCSQTELLCVREGAEVTAWALYAVIASVQLQLSSSDCTSLGIFRTILITVG